MSNYGDYRSAREAGFPLEAWIAANEIENMEERLVALEDWWVSSNMDEVAGLVKWGRCGRMKTWGETHAHQSLFMIGYEDWSLMLGGVEIRNAKNFDTSEFTREFARTAAKDVYNIWKDWAADNAPEMLHNVFHALNAGKTKDPYDALINLGEDAANFAKGMAETHAMGSSEYYQAMAAREAAWAAYCYAYSFKESSYSPPNHAKDAAIAAMNSIAYAVVADKILVDDFDTRYNHRLTRDLLLLIKSKRREPPFKKKRDW